ncbi:MAG: sigma-54-dependent Fis family transcriptional regulator, partial [Deltaproteobacteria bacterium]|nr:sigma-54-dependent Fis family transcriptional regulator [Deltaproteobacteria bacterium]
MTKRVLFIDDELDLWEDQIREELKQFDFEVRGEENPSNALNAIGSYRPDLVLLDILFPGGYLGKPTLVKIKEKHPDLPVIMITSTMDKNEYKPEDYALSDYRYSKAALADGDYSDLAQQIDRLIEKSRSNRSKDLNDSGLARYGFIVGNTHGMKEVTEIIEKVADQDQTVLITGESGTGKELAARAIHRLGKRKNEPFVTVVCAALPKDLLESELFGHEKGAFTGAVSQKQGRFELAGGGTIFLDEIAEIPPETQVKLLRFLQERTFERVGGTVMITSNTRIIAATNRDLKERVRQETFREDLYFRLNVVSIHVPPLRNRMKDLP